MQSVYSRLAGYEDLNDALRVARLEAEPGSRRGRPPGCSASGRYMLASDENLIGLMAVNRELVARADVSDDSERIVLYMDSTESPIHG